MTTFNTSPHSSKDEMTIQLQIPHQHVGETVNWLVEQSIPFGAHFLQTHLSALPIINDETETFLPSAEKTTKRASEINADQKTLERRISNVFDSSITNRLTKLPLTQEEIAEELNISVSTFKARFRALYGKSFNQVYMDKKMEYVAELLEGGYKAVDVSVQLGYSQPIKFSKMFQKHFGVTPRRYQMEKMR